MATQHTTSQARKSIVCVALVALGLVVLSGSLDQLSAQVTSLVAGAATETLACLPALVLAGWQAFQPHACDHSRLALHVLVSSWSLLQAMACAA
jgi:hypothetical protein